MIILPHLTLLLLSLLSSITRASSNHAHFKSPSLEYQLSDLLGASFTNKETLNTSTLQTNITSISAQKVNSLKLYAGSVSPTYNLTFSYFASSNGFPNDIPGTFAYNEDGSVDTSFSVTRLYFSANLCTMPKNDVDGNSQNSLVGTLFFDNETLVFPIEFKHGYASQDIALRNRRVLQTKSLLISIGFDNPHGDYDDNEDYFEIQFGVSSSDWIFKNDLPKGYIRYIDSDSDSVLLEMENCTEVLQEPSNYYLELFEASQMDKWQYLNESVCYISTLAKEISHVNHEIQRLNTSVSGVTKITSLTADTTYKAYYIYTKNDTEYQILNILEFTTAQEGVCKLVNANDMPFCQMVQYSIPQSQQYLADQNYTALISTYDDYARQVYENFTLALSLAGCDESEDQIYSPITSCEECADTYKNWLCSVLIPRCSTNSSRIERSSLRNEALTELVNPVPYHEVLPCIDLCFAIVRSCPPLFGFNCPRMMMDMTDNYGFKNDANEEDGDGVDVGCNFVGDPVYKESIKTIGPQNVFG